MVDLLVEIVGELLVQGLAEVLVELGLHSLWEPFRAPPRPWLAAIGYVLFGAIAGLLSLLAFPSHLVPVGSWRVVNLVVTPVAAGLCMIAMGSWRRRRGDALLRIDKFAYGYLFALVFALMRFWIAR